MSDMVQGKTGFGEYPFEGARRVVGYAPIEGTPWSIAVGAAKADVFVQVTAMSLAIVALSCGFAALGIAVTILVSKGIVRPIGRTVAMLKDISEGEGDLTRELEIGSKDEMGELARYFNLTLGKVRYLVRAIRRQSEILSEVGLELSANMTETAAAVNQIGANIESVRSMATNQSASAVETNATMGQITLNIEKLDAHIERQSASVSHSSSAVEEMLSSIASVSRTLSDDAKGVDELATASERGRADLATASGRIREVVKDSAGLIEILRSIGLLNEITGEVKAGSTEMLASSREVIQESRNLERMAEEVAGSMAEMATGTRQISVAVNSVNDISTRNKDSIDALLSEIGKFKVDA